MRAHFTLSQGLRPGLCAAVLVALLGSCADAGEAPGNARQRRFGDSPQSQPAADTAAQESEDQWLRAVRTACNARRYGLRLAASRKVAEGGDAAVPAIRARIAEHGLDSIPVSLVDQMAVAQTTGPEVLALLGEWADAETFYWRGQALRGLANRVRALSVAESAPAALIAQAPRFRRAMQDPAWITRAEGARGLLGLLRIPAAVATDAETEDRIRIEALLTDSDPRVRVEVAGAYLEGDDPRGTPVLLAAAVDRRFFLGDPWGQRLAQRAAAFLAAWTGTGEEMVRGRDRAGFGDVLRGWRLAAEAAWEPEPLPTLPTPAFPPPAEVDGGVEIRSCRHGDMFLRWNRAGQICVGLEPKGWVDLPAAAIPGLREALRPHVGDGVHGPVVCDYLRLRALTGEGPPGTPEAGEVHRRIAPGSAPEELYAWLQQLADALANGGQHEQAGRLRTRLEQFARPD